MSTKNLSIISYLGGETYKQVRTLQKELFELTGARMCLEDWLPHITTGSGIIVDDTVIPALEDNIRNTLRTQKSFSVHVEGFEGIEDWKGAIPGVITPYVIWFSVEMNTELLNHFNLIADTITSKYETFLPRIVQYIPHITLAFGDLQKDGYVRGMEYLKNMTTISFDFTISHLALVESYGPGNMESVEYRKFYF